MHHQRRWMLLAAALLLLAARIEGLEIGKYDDQSNRMQQSNGAIQQDSMKEWCAQMCAPTSCPACNPAPCCPQPVCPKPSPCPSLPPIPPCPRPIVNLSCPEPKTPLLPTSLAGNQHDYDAMLRAFIGNKLKLYTTKETWFKAKEICAREGAHLVVPKTRAQQVALIDIMLLNDVTHLHVGFEDNAKEGYYMTVLGKPMDSTQTKMWDKGQPNGGRGENCAVMYDNGKMHDWPCTSKFAFVCEKRQ